MDGSSRPEMTAGGAIFVKLKALGVDCVFTNSGTDFPPIIEGLAAAGAAKIPLPRPVIVPHEHVALGMAHGYYFATGKAQAVMLHTNVGLANGAIGAINAATDHVPVILMSGRTPATERDRFGGRTVPIGWGQEMRDQTALVRESCKWDYELRFPEQVGELLDRAHGVALSTPKGPVYLSLPREVLCESCPTDGLEEPARMAPAVAGARAVDIEQAAELLAAARRPVIFAQRGAGSEAGFETLDRLADEWAIPVCHYWACALALGSDHPMNVGDDPLPWIEAADVLLVLDSLAPWSPDTHRPQADAKVIQMGPNPLYSRFPVRNFRSDISIACELEEGLAQLYQAMQPHKAAGATARGDRFSAVAKASGRIRAAAARQAEAGERQPMTKAFVGKCLSEAIAGRDAVVLSELGVPLSSLTLNRHNSWRQEPHSGGLGWSVPCAMGMKLGDPDRFVVATMGDGSYMFANPTACHQVMEAYDIAVLIIVVNNGEWGAVRHSVKGMYPDGYAAGANVMPMTALSPSPDFSLTAAASRVWAKKVTDPLALPDALAEAVKIVAEDRRPALLDVSVGD